MTEKPFAIGNPNAKQLIGTDATLGGRIQDGRMPKEPAHSKASDRLRTPAICNSRRRSRGPPTLVTKLTFAIGHRQ
jgi:hypothetical protein